MSDAGSAQELMGGIYSRGFLDGIERAERFQREVNEAATDDQRVELTTQFVEEVKRAQESPRDFGCEQLEG